MFSVAESWGWRHTQQGKHQREWNMYVYSMSQNGNSVTDVCVLAAHARRRVCICPQEMFPGEADGSSQDDVGVKGNRIPVSRNNSPRINGDSPMCACTWR